MFYKHLLFIFLPIAEDEESSGKAPKSADTMRSAKTLQERAAARHSAKMEKSRQ